MVDGGPTIPLKEGGSGPFWKVDGGLAIRDNKEILLPYFDMTVAKLTSKNQLTLPKAVMERVGRANYFEVAFSGGKIVLTPLRIGGADAVREKLAKLHLRESDIDDAIAWARNKRS